MRVTVCYEVETDLGNEVPQLLRSRFEQVTVLRRPTQTEILAASVTSDLIWWEWALDGLAYLTSLPRRCPIIVRGRAGDISPRLTFLCHKSRHRFDRSKHRILEEIQTINKKVNFINQNIDWTKIDLLLFCADHIEREFRETFPDISVPTSVFLGKKFEYKNKSEFPNKACIVGRIQCEKDYLFAFEAFKDLPEFTLVLQGCAEKRSSEYNEPNYLQYIKRVAPPNIEFRDWGDPREIYDESAFILSTSVCEGIANTVMEGMSRGCVAVCRDWKHASEYYSGAIIVSSPSDISRALKSWMTCSYADKLKRSESQIDQIKKDARKGGEPLSRLSEILDLVM